MNSLVTRLGLRTLLGLLLAGSLLACTVAWFGSVMFADARLARMIQRESIGAQADADLASTNLDLRLSQARSVSQTLAQDPIIQSELSRFGPNVRASPLPLAERGAIWRADPALKPIARRMSQIVEKFGLTTLWVTNAAGDTLAEGHSEEVSPFTGINYADRAYFKSAQQGQNGRQFAIGRATNVYGLFYSSPVLVDNQFMGMVGAGLAVPKLRSAIEQFNAVVTDDLGVIVLANDPALLLQTMPDANVTSLSPDELDKRYKRQTFTAANLRSEPGYGSQSLYRWRNLEQTHVMATRPTRDGALRIYILRDLGESFDSIRRDQLWWFGLVSALVLLLSLLLARGAQFIFTTQRHQIELQQLNEELSRQASTDVLTGCANRRHFMQVLEQERDRSNRYGACFTVLSLDIDHFKRVNDTYGHAAGDEVLKHFVATVQSNLRDTDTLGRMGGEEFSVLLPQTPTEGGATMAERIRASVEASPAIFGTTHIAVTVSIGGFERQPGNTHSLDALLVHADEALYNAKNGGRNRVQWAQTLAGKG